jgi:hypothetical protein
MCNEFPALPAILYQVILSSLNGEFVPRSAPSGAVNLRLMKQLSPRNSAGGKELHVLLDADATLADRINTAFSGTSFRMAAEKWWSTAPHEYQIGLIATMQQSVE